MKLANWMSRIGTETAFEVLARARALEAQGKKIIHLQIGEPDFDTPKNICEKAKEAIDKGFTHYGPSAGLPQTRAALALAQTHVDNTKLASPLAGVVLSHNIEPGEFVAAGTPIVTVADTAHLWVRAYLNQTDLGRIQHGQKVAVRTDTFPGKTYDGTIGFIASEAEFTPKTVQTPKERVKLVFRIKVDLVNVNDELKPGMPADVILPAAP